MLLIALGVMIVAIGIALMSMGFSNATREDATAPKTNDHRIVRMDNGTYLIQYYWAIPGWANMLVEYKTEAEARSVMESLDRKHTYPQVVEVMK